ncbi:MAG: hypothetical protein LBC51_11990 [Treponema sp.]|jgi:outer membrane lipoprotein-sorting protein|nr:hypothetical protein [Treponema sp.]
MKKKMLGILAVVMAVVFMITGGFEPSAQKPNPVIKTDAGQDYASIDAESVSFETEVGTLIINNQTNFDVVIFAGKKEN